MMIAVDTSLATDISLEINDQSTNQLVQLQHGGVFRVKLKVAPGIDISRLDISSDNKMVEALLKEKLNILDEFAVSDQEQVLKKDVALPSTLPAGKFFVNVNINYVKNGKSFFVKQKNRFIVVPKSISSRLMGFASKHLPGDVALEILNVLEPKKIKRLNKEVEEKDIKGMGVTLNQLQKIKEMTVEEKIIKQDTIETAVNKAMSTRAKEAIQAMAKKKSRPIVKKSVSIYKVKGQEKSYINKIVVSVTSDNGMNSLELVEIIPKSVAESAGLLVFSERPLILESDPIVKWSFNNLPKDETKDFSYTVKTTEPVDETQLTSVAVGKNPGLTARLVRWELEKGMSAWIVTGIIFLLLIVVVFIVLPVALFKKRRLKRLSLKEEKIQKK